jgi:membrane protease YdiL (CAAX protease family)
VGVTLLHFVFADLLRLRRSYAAAIAVVGAAVAFALYHHFRLASGHIDWPTVLFRTAAGVYFGMLYLMRGFGVVAATHAFYDVLVLVLLTGEGV